MGPQCGEQALSLQLCQHITSIPDTHNQGLTARGTCVSQFPHALLHKGPLPPGHICLGPKIRLHYVKRQHITPLSRMGQGAVIVHPQIPFEPHNLHRLSLRDI